MTNIRPEDVGYDHSSVMSNRTSVGGSRPHSSHSGLDTHSLVTGHMTMTSNESDTREDPLFNMLMTLQEAANTQTGDL